MKTNGQNLLPDNVFAVVLAGGSGTRFWPKSRQRKPKQLCAIGDNDCSMIELTLRRLDKLVPSTRRLVVTHQDQVELTKKMTHGLCDHYLAEPSARNTANALLLAAIEVQKMAEAKGIPNPIMLSVHADALIKRLDIFEETMQKMVASAQTGKLTLLGITPEYPETGYGYIEKGLALTGLDMTFEVSSFREKPDVATATRYIETKRFLWNSGIFAWSISTILSELENFLPRSVSALQKVIGSSDSFTRIPEDRLAETYDQLQSIAIDPAVLEKSKKVSVVEADIGWKDVGSWDALSQCFPTDSSNNLFYGDVIAIDSESLTVDSDAKVVACIGVKDLIVVVSDGAVLICPKDRAQDVKHIVDRLKDKGRLDLI